MDLCLSKNKTTEALENEIVEANNIDDYISDNGVELLKIELADYLNQLLEKYSVDKSIVFTRAQMNETNYGYEIFSGKKKNISRDKLIQLCFGFPLTIDEAKNVLRLGKTRPLYSRDERDAYIMFALKNAYTIQETDELLHERKLNTIT